MAVERVRDPANQEAHYRLAQELYLVGRYAEAPIAELSTGTRRIVELAGLTADAELVVLQRGDEVVGTLQLNFLRGLGLQGAHCA